MENPNMNPKNAFTVGVFLLAGLGLLGYFISHGLIGMKELDRTIAVKGLSERDVPADIAIWPIKYLEAGDDLGVLYSAIQKKNNLIIEFLMKNGFRQNEITVSSPSITDKRASQGQFTIEDRDANTPHVKKVRVVATIEYYLSD